MPSRQKHRGQQGSDNRLFGEKYRNNLREAVKDLSWLFTKGYAAQSALKIVGDRYRLHARQRMAVLRSSCSDQSLKQRMHARVEAGEVQDKRVLIDGFNLLITVECMLSGAYLFRGRDGCIRDIAGIHGSYRRIQETHASIRLIGNILSDIKVKETLWLLDAPVSNSGRLKRMLTDAAREKTWDWEVVLDNNPDHILVASEDVVLTTDAWILDRAKYWLNFNPLVADKLQIHKQIVPI